MHFAGYEVWTARPQRLGCGGCAELARVLDAQEQERASRLAFEADRRAFVVAHAMRRIALGAALGVDAQDLRFGAGAHGQPLLLHAQAGALAFSLTRSRELVALAVSRSGPVGIDVEPLGDGVDAQLLAPYLALPASREPLGDERFYACWTALEAYWKARGLGLSAAHPRIELHDIGEDCFEVGLAGRSAGMFVMRLPAPRTHVLSLACSEPENVRLVELEGLAPAPRALAAGAQPGCTQAGCPPAAARAFSS